MKKKELLEIKNIIGEMKTKITRRLDVNVEGMPWKVEQKNEVVNSRREMMKKPENQCSWSNNNQERLTKGRI